ncbi:MAG: M14 family zinc carboxypeptidase [Robiginitalea sp.]
MTERTAYERIKASGFEGRYLPPDRLEVFLTSHLPKSAVEVLGYSVEKRPVFGVHLGNGPIRVLMWSQMHGNESTTTRAVLDLISSLNKKGFQGQEALEFLFIPMLNPDGAQAYTRQNANQADLNRDARLQNQPESRILRKAYEEFAPHYCFNLHDQRTIFSAGDKPQPATLSFLAPAANVQKEYTDSRRAAAQLIAALSRPLRDLIGIGRYDDTFNPDCVGDFFQAAGTPTLLFEAGHFPGDYERKETRFYVYQALQNALKAIQSGDYRDALVSDYTKLPENKSKFLDILISNAHLLDETYKVGAGVGLQYTEVLEKGRIYFRPDIVHKGTLQGYYGHECWDAARPDHLRQLKASEDLMRLF